MMTKETTIKDRIVGIAIINRRRMNRTMKTPSMDCFADVFGNLNSQQKADRPDFDRRPEGLHSLTR